METQEQVYQRLYAKYVQWLNTYDYYYALSIESDDEVERKTAIDILGVMNRNIPIDPISHDEFEIYWNCYIHNQ